MTLQKTKANSLANIILQKDNTILHLNNLLKQLQEDLTTIKGIQQQYLDVQSKLRDLEQTTTVLTLELQEKRKIAYDYDVLFNIMKTLEKNCKNLRSNLNMKDMELLQQVNELVYIYP